MIEAAVESSAPTTDVALGQTQILNTAAIAADVERTLNGS